MAPAPFDLSAADDDELLASSSGSGSNGSSQRAIPLRLLGRSGLARPGGTSSGLYGANSSSSSGSGGRTAGGASRFQSRYAANSSSWRASQRAGLTDNDERDESVGLLADGADAEHDGEDAVGDDGGLRSARASDPRPAQASPHDQIASGASPFTQGGTSSSVSAGKGRTIPLPQSAHLSSAPIGRFAPNVVRNQKYNPASFLPLVLYEQFKFFFNAYFLAVALSQFVPALKIGYIVTYVAPLAFVLLVTMAKEAFDDYQRWVRDREANSTRYLILDSGASAASHNGANGESGAGSSTVGPTRAVPSSALKVGDLVLLEKDQRVPADLVLLRTSDEAGGCFVRTDQLDGETDWKLRLAVPAFQPLTNDDLLAVEGEVYADPPIKDLHTFVGTITHRPLTGSRPSSPRMSSTVSESQTDPLTADNLLWANTVLAAGSAIGLVVYTGRETRAVMNTSRPETKVGLLEHEVNRIAKILCAGTFALALALVGLNGFRGQWIVYTFRFLILFSSIIPISLRVNLDMGKTVYAHAIQTDSEIPGTIVRTSTLPEELGRIEYLLSDKTGTLTQNEMVMKKLHLGTMSYGQDSFDEVAHQLSTAIGGGPAAGGTTGRRTSAMPTGAFLANRGRRDMSSKVKDALLALAICHNVTPVDEDGEAGTVTYQASSPDEVAIVQFTEQVGLTLIARDRSSMTLRLPDGATQRFEVLEIFPFTSESKRMGIVVRESASGEITFYEKGADVVMGRIVQRNDWLDEETGNMSREGLRTLVVGKKRLSAEAFERFARDYRQARTRTTEDRAEAIAAVVGELEHELELLAVTGVEDKLQEDVRPTLELLRNAGIKTWMLTGDKIETATCIAISSKLVSRGQYIHQVAKLSDLNGALEQLDFLRTKLDCCLVIDGDSLELFLTQLKTEFIELATQLPCVVACRCSPTQKADVARLIRAHTRKRVCCIGDGGNDVSMIQAADVGLGIVGKEGRQASLAADFSITQFSFITKLLLWHGRNSYKRSAKLAQFVIHRGLIISVMQAVFSAIFFYAPIALFQGWLQVGYATVYTMAPVFSLVLDRDVDEDVALLYPELYKDLTKGRSLSTKTFLEWCLVSVFQGGAIMILSLLLFETEFLNIVAISFTALILNELIMVALEITKWHVFQAISLVVTLLVYAGSMAFLPEYFNLSFVLSTGFLWRVAVIIGVSSVPLYILHIFQRIFRPATYAKLAA